MFHFPSHLFPLIIAPKQNWHRADELVWRHAVAHASAPSLAFPTHHSRKGEGYFLQEKDNTGTAEDQEDAYEWTVKGEKTRSGGKVVSENLHCWVNHDTKARDVGAKMIRHILGLKGGGKGRPAFIFLCRDIQMEKPY